jgi:hypothetical protein
MRWFSTAGAHFEEEDDQAFVSHTFDVENMMSSKDSCRTKFTRVVDVGVAA